MKNEKQEEIKQKKNLMPTRFRGYLPVVVDVETSGLNPQENALLEIAVVTTKFNEEDILVPDESFTYHLIPFEGAKIDKKALEFNGIDPSHPFRFPMEEKKAMVEVYNKVAAKVKEQSCTKAILVGHNAWFDLHFMQAAANRSNIKKSPFHSFSSLDTATLSALAFKHTVLAKACAKAKIKFNQEEAHSALYDAQKTAELFCKIVNSFKDIDV